MHLAKNRSANYGFFFISFALCAPQGFIGLIAAKLLMADNPAGNQARFAVCRYVGTVSVFWTLIAAWAWYRIRRRRRRRTVK